MIISPRAFFRRFAAIIGCSLCLLPAFNSYAESPRVLNHQGRIAVNGANFNGTGQFKFALVSSTGNQSYWCNDGSTVNGTEPATAVSLPITRGLYSVLLGDAALTNMTPVPASVFENADVRIRVWFNDGTHGFQQITPDHRLAASPYAMIAERALTASEVSLGSIMASPSKPVLAWGNNSIGQINVPPLAAVSAVAAAENHSLALLDDGTVVSWGNGSPVPGTLTLVTAIAAGSSHDLARKSNGTVVAWGNNDYGKATVPANITNATSVAAGDKHSLILRSDGTVTAWGDNTFGQTGVPPGLSNIIAIAAGNDHSLALKSDGTVVAWGRDDAGQITIPNGLNGVTAIAAGAYHSLAVKSDGTVVAWGWDNGGQSTVPPGLGGVSSVTAGYAFSAALKSDGSIVTWGDNANGQRTIPSGATHVTRLAAGASHMIALRADMIPAQVARLDEDNIFSGRIGIKRSPAANPLEVEGAASKTTAGNWLSNSDRRIKTDIHTLTGALDTIDQVRLVDFRYTDAYRAANPSLNDGRYLNVIAQEFATVFPAHVHNSGENMADGSPILQVDTYPLTIYSAAAIQELHRENEILKLKLADQENRLKRLEALIQTPAK